MGKKSCKLKIDPAHLAYLRQCFKKPPAQGKVGSSPTRYLQDLNKIRETKLAWPENGGRGKLDREEVRELAQDPEVDLLIAYTAAMAWGGRNFSNYRYSLEDPSGKNLVKLLEALRASKLNRQKDFKRTDTACKQIKGLGISFYTKLLFFLRADANAYILDQWTAKSAVLLFPECPIRLTSQGMPSAETRPKDYDWFCQALECLGTQMQVGETWTGEEVERAIFDDPKGKWRAYVSAHFPDGKKRGAAKSRKTSENDKPVPNTCRHKLGAQIVVAHQKAIADDRALPGSGATLGRSKSTVRVSCGSRNGVNWQYDIQLSKVHAKVFIPATQINRLRKTLDDVETEEIDLRRPKNKTTGSARITIGRGASQTAEWDEIASDAVDAMNQLFETVGEIL
jgi:hypothetical protein